MNRTLRCFDNRVARASRGCDTKAQGGWEAEAEVRRILAV